MQLYGPHLATSLVKNVTGEAARSDLDYLAEPLKKLVVSQPKSRVWISHALEVETQANKHIGDNEKRIWLQKIFR